MHRHTRAPLQRFAAVDRFDTVHVDLVGPLPPSGGFIYLLSCVDRFSRWPEVVPLRDITASSVATTFLDTWVSRYGFPRCVISDRGRQFESHLWRDLLSALGIVHRHTIAYHPQANGMVERFHHQLKNSLRATISASGKN